MKSFTNWLLEQDQPQDQDQAQPQAQAQPQQQTQNPQAQTQAKETDVEVEQRLRQYYLQVNNPQMKQQIANALNSQNLASRGEVMRNLLTTLDQARENPNTTFTAPDYSGAARGHNYQPITGWNPGKLGNY